MPNIETLINDIDKLFLEYHQPCENNLDILAADVRACVKEALENDPKSDKFRLRMSNIGKPLRQLVLDSRNPEIQRFEANQYRLFLFGHIMEALLLFLIRETGHTVEDYQKEVTLEGVLGHKDVKIDGVNIDVKTASPYSYAKFVKNELFRNDPFGYLHQLGGYNQADEHPTEKVGWLVFNKVDGNLHLSLVDSLELPDAKKRIRQVKKALETEELPDKCYPDIPDGESGNRKLDIGCVRCIHKKTCWPEVRAFEYSNGVRYLTHVEKQPRVPEITEE